MSNLNLANNLFKLGKYREAEKIYLDLYNETGLETYLINIDMCKKKYGDPLVGSSSPDNRALSSTKGKILFITAGLKGPTAGGGIATCFHSMIKTLGLSKNNIVEVIYIAHPYYSTEGYEYWKNQYKEECNVIFRAIPVLVKNYGSKEMLRSYSVMEFLKKNENEYKTVVFHDFMGLGYFPMLAKRQGIHFRHIRFIISAHGNHILSNYFGRRKIDSWHQKAIIFMERKSLEYADDITSPSSFYKNWLQKNLGIDENKISVLPNILFENKTSNILDVTFKDPHRKLIVFYGRLERLKGIDVLIDTVKEIESKDVILNILFAGVKTKIDGLDCQEYIDKKLLGSKSQIQYRFNCQPDEVFNFIKQNNGICVLPTLGENAPCVIVECILYGVPFLASDIPGIVEMVRKGWQPYHLFETGNVRQLAEKILLSNVPSPTMDTLSYSMKEVQGRWIDYIAHSSKCFKKPSFKFEDYDVAEDPLVSVIIPTCDRSELLCLAVESIISQTYSNIEVFIVDDASENHIANYQIAKRFDIGYVLLTEKGYKGKACNTGANYAKGEYICFFDDDDIANPEMIELYVKAFKNCPEFDILSGFCTSFEHNSEDFGVNHDDNQVTSLALGGGLEVNFSINMFGKGSFIMKAQSFIEVGGYEEDNASVPLVDYRFYMKSALSGMNISVVPNSQYFYRKNSPNSLYSNNINQRYKLFLAKQSMQSIFEKKIGADISKALTPMIWDVSLPKFI